MTRSQRTKLAAYFERPEEPYRAANLEFDYGSVAALARYIPTAKSTTVIDAICAALQEGARDRAISVIAPYGSGKTSLLLFLCAVLESDRKTRDTLASLLERLRTISPATAKQLAEVTLQKKGHVVVPLAGYQGNLPILLLQGLRDALGRRRLSAILGEHLPKTPSHEDVLSAYGRAAREVTKRGYQGLAIIYDEFGKVLEAHHGEARPADLFLLQNLAELCGRSGRAPLLLVVTLHQGFAQYAQRLSAHLRNEWAKIEGRFRVVHYVEDSLQVYELIAQALRQLHGERYSSLRRIVAACAKRLARESKAIPCFAQLQNASHRERLCTATFPLHPLGLYVLPRLSARVAQNERTLFSFLLGQEEQAFAEIIRRKHVGKDGAELVTVADLYDYFAQLMAADVGVGGTHRRLIEIKAALDRIHPSETFAARLIKTIGLLSVIGERFQAPVNREMLAFALDTRVTDSTFSSALDALVEKKIVLHRRHTGEYRIWEGSDIDLLSLVRQRKAETESTLSAGSVLSRMLRAPAILPHRHNEDCAISRAFEGGYGTTTELAEAVKTFEKKEWLRDADGKALYVLAETTAEIEEAEAHARKITHPQVLVATPTKPLRIPDLVLELSAIEELLHDKSVVAEDPVIRRELSELADDCLVTLRRDLSRFHDPGQGAVRWWHKGEPQPAIRSTLSLRRYISTLCAEEIFSCTPRINSELINKRRPTAVIVNARKKLLRAMLDHYGEKDFGLTGYGPDVSMFRAVFLVPGWYQEQPGGQWALAPPDAITEVRLGRAVRTIHEFLRAAHASATSIQELIDALTAPPYGLREGVLPLVLAAAVKTFFLPLNLMEQGVYVKELKAETFEQMVAAPAQITVQCVPLPEHVRAYLLNVHAAVSLNGGGPLDAPDPLRAAVENLYRWIHKLPPCAHAANAVSAEARAVRTHLLKAADPVRLLFVDLPGVATQMQARQGGTPWLSKQIYARVVEVLRNVRVELDEVEARYREAVARVTRDVFRLGAGSVDGLRNELRQWLDARTRDIPAYVVDPQCSGLLERIRSQYETDRHLAESMASLVTGKSIAHWEDFHLKQYELGLLALHRRLLQTEDLLADRANGHDHKGPIKERIHDPLLWERLEHLTGTDRRLLAHHLLETEAGRGEDA